MSDMNARSQHRKTFRSRTLMALVAAIAGVSAIAHWWSNLEESIVLAPAIIEIEISNPLPGKQIFGGRLVRPDGTINLGYYGDVHVAGLTPREIKEKIVIHLRKYLTDEALGLTKVETTSSGKLVTKQVAAADSEQIKITILRIKPPYGFLHRIGPFWLSLRVASCATVGIFLVGLPVAFALARWQFPGKGVGTGLLMLPLVMPPTVVGFLLLQVVGRRAPLGMWLESVFGVTLVFHWSGAVLASAVAAFPLFLIPAKVALEAVDPGLEDAARLLGRREMSVFLHVTIPLAWRGLLAGVILAFARALGDFGATLMVAGDLPGRTRTASLAIFDAVQTNDKPTAWLFSSLIAGTSIIALAIVQSTQASREEGR